MGVRACAVRWMGACAFAVLAGAAAARGSDAIEGDPYIVVLSEGVPASDVDRVAAELIRRNGGALQHVYREGLRGFAARLPALSASGIRRDPRVVALESITEGGSAAETAATEAPAPAAELAVRRSATRERLAFAPGTAAPKLRRVLTPAADRYRVVLAESVTDAEAQGVADRLLLRYGGERGAVDGGTFRAHMAEAAAREMSRDAAVAYIEEQSIDEPMDPAQARQAPRQIPGQRLRLVAEPVRDLYRVVLRAGVRDELLESTIDELLRAYEGKRRAVRRSDDPRVVLVEMSEPAARALSDDFRVEYVEEQAAATRAGAR
jgi:peptidase inhibitor I9